MKKSINKRILGLLVFSFVFLLIGFLSPLTVNAEISKNCQNAMDGLKATNSSGVSLLQQRYQVVLDYNPRTGYYTAKLQAPKGKDADLVKNPKLKLTKLSIYVPDANNKNTTDMHIDYTTDDQIKRFVDKQVITPGKTIKINRNELNPEYDYMGLEVTFEPTDGYQDPTLKKNCTEDDRASFYVTYSIVTEVYRSMYDGKVYTYEIGESIDGSSSKSINCEGDYGSRYDNKSFEYNFCHDMEEAKKDPNTKKYTFGDLDEKFGDKHKNMISYKCDTKDTVLPASNDDSEYYVNRKYIIGEGTETHSGQYKYNTGECGDQPITEDISCEVKCEEVVTVEYGAPISTKNGFCFEYKVKVTSRVNCDITQPPKKPSDAVVCTPTPYCEHSSDGHIGFVGGPNEEFDKCIKKCDGGKYSLKCSNKCYKKVYGKSISRKTSGNEIAYADKLNYHTANVQKVSGDDTLYTYVCVNNQIIWNVGQDGQTATRNCGNNCGSNSKVNTDSYWHLHNDWSAKINRNLRGYDDVGIIVNTVEGCTSNCEWLPNTTAQCTDSKYIHYINHPEVYNSEIRRSNGLSTEAPIDKDYRENTKEYERLLNVCKAKASCNTTTAEFTISVDYQRLDENGKPMKKETIDFPLSTKKDTITATDKTNDNVKCSNDAENKNSVFLSYAGCYDCGKTPGEPRLYVTEWSFPGTWIGTGKHNWGEIQYYYDKLVVKEDWKYSSEKFCLPMDIKDTNAKWYKYYFAKVYGNDESISINNEEYMNSLSCPAGQTLVGADCDYMNYKNSTFTNDEIEWNIHATAKKFGYFDWNLGIDCFYASNSNMCTPRCDDGTITPPPTDSATSYRVTTYEPTNMFPDDEGNKLSSPDVTGRTPGFNWSSWAEQEIKDPKYVSEPSKYVKFIQSKGTAIYSDEYLDYEVVLSKDDINKLRQNGKNYTDWQGKTEVNSVTNYESPLFRNGGILSGSSKYPNGQALKCNNMKNWQSSECENFSGEAK